MTRGPIRLAVDVGGTFTDLLLTGFGGRMWFGKRLTTPDDPCRAICEGMLDLLGQTALEPGIVAGVVHATTLMTNALLARTGARAALITTRGFRDVLETGRENRYNIYDLTQRRPRPLVDRALRLEVTERMGADGRTLELLDEGELEQAARALLEAGVTAVAVGFLHSHLYPAHERRAGAVLTRSMPGIPITLSSDVAPEQGEYERFTTATANAYVQPIAGPYLTELAERLGRVGLQAQVHMMASDGGLTNLGMAARQPVRLIEGGPAAGAVAASAVARARGLSKALSFDMGGTTAKVCLVRNGRPSLAKGFEAARLDRVQRGSGLPLRIPSVDLIEIGAGGGSVGWVDRLGLLRVGPESAGADPGPACYGRRGHRPTLTDCCLLLGYLGAEGLLGGKLPLDRMAAERALAAIAGPLGLDPVGAASAMVRIATEAMAAAARMHLAEQGQQAAQTTLLAFGGAGPLFADALGRSMRMSAVLVPPGAGVLSAAGLLAAAPKTTLVRSEPTRLGEATAETIQAAFGQMQQAAATLLADTGTLPDDVSFERSIHVRLVGGGGEFEIPLPPAAFDPAWALDQYASLFQDAFGVHPGEQPVDIVSLKMEASGRPPVIDWSTQGQPTIDAPRSRPAWFAGAGWLDCTVLRRSALMPDHIHHGPVLIEDGETTILAAPGTAVHADETGFVTLSLTSGGRPTTENQTAACL